MPPARQPACSKLQHVGSGAEAVTGESGDMGVVGEQDHLATLAEGSQRIERLRRAGFIETRQKVVADKGQRLEPAALEQRQSQHQEQLIGGSLAQAVELDLAAIGAAGNENRLVLLVVIHVE